MSQCRQKETTKKNRERLPISTSDSQMGSHPTETPKMEFLIRFSQTHETFRLPEIEALALIEGVDLEVVSYSLDVCYFSLPLET